MTISHHARKRSNGDWWNMAARQLSLEELTWAVAPLIKQLTKYDRLRLQLESVGGDLSLLVAITNTLSEPIRIQGASRSHTLSLIDQGGFRSMLYDLGEFTCYLQIRRLDTGMPVYYFCRTEYDYRSTYSIIMEDLYMSPGYPLFDERFLKIMRHGHEEYFLRLSSFSKKTMQMLAKDSTKKVQEEEVDELLGNVGRYILQAAWHEDQFVGITAARYFLLPWFQRAIELLYLCLSGELCEIRRVINQEVNHFFIHVYEQPAIHYFLGLLNQLDGEALCRVPQKALKLYPRLTRHFGDFLRVELPWGQQRNLIPLYKLLFANFWRLDVISNSIAENESIKNGVNLLENKSKELIKTLFEELENNQKIK